MTPRALAALILISDALPFGRLWYAGPNAASNAIGYAKHRSRSHLLPTLAAVRLPVSHAGSVLSS
jgi:hypothetical protein